MWVFLATEVLFFGGLFCGYTIYRNLYLPGFVAGSHLLDVRFGATNTAILILSSLTMALAVHAAQLGQRKRLILFLILTMILGLAFIGIKLTFEWRHDYLEHLAPVSPPAIFGAEDSAATENSRRQDVAPPFRAA